MFGTPWSSRTERESTWIMPSSSRPEGAVLVHVEARLHRIEHLDQHHVVPAVSEPCGDSLVSSGSLMKSDTRKNSARFVTDEGHGR